MLESSATEQPAASLCGATKICPKCHTGKALCEFSKNKNTKSGLSCWCKLCESVKRKILDEKNRRRDTISAPSMKRCPSCGLEQSSAEFGKNKGKKDGLAGVCKKCATGIVKTCRKKNKSRDFIVYPEKKTCSGCNIEKPGSEFSNTKLEKSGLQSHCKMCVSMYHKKHTFGVSSEWFGSTLVAQGNGCAICQTKTPGGRGDFHIDHNHSNGAIRGLLCSNCNTGLGYFRDDTNSVDRAKSYLDSQTYDIRYREHIGDPTRYRILTNQGFQCKVCFTPISVKSVCLDHCHSTGMIRGGLCSNCNSGLGRFKDSLDLLQKAIDYLNKGAAC